MNLVNKLIIINNNKQAYKRRDLLDTVKIILEFSEAVQPYLT